MGAAVVNDQQQFLKILALLEHADCSCRHLGQVVGFTGNDKDYYNPDNSCINMVLQSHTGIPITLGLLYMAVAQRLGLRLHGLNLPGHFMIGNNVEGVTNLLVDPFHGKI